jgi:hypothetical protein
MYRDQVPDPSLIVDGKYDGHTILDRPPGSKVMRAGPYYGVVEPAVASYSNAPKTWVIIRFGRLGEQTELNSWGLSIDTEASISERLERLVQNPPEGAPPWVPVLRCGTHWVDLGCSLPYMAAELLLTLKLQSQ